MPKMAFLMANSFFLVRFQKYQPKGHFCAIDFKLNQSRNTKIRFFWGGFLQKYQKRAFLGVQNSSFKNSNFKFVFLCLFFDVKRSFMPIFTKNINIEAP